MKTRFFIIIGVLAAAIISSIPIILVFDQDIKISGLIASNDSESQVIIDDPLCFAISNSTRGELCYSLDVLHDYGCSKSMLEHLAEYSNVIDYEWHDMFYLEWISLPEGMSEKKFDECFKFLSQQRADSYRTVSPVYDLTMPRTSVGLDSTPEHLPVPFAIIKENMEKTGYDICNVQLDENKIIIDLHKFFEGTEQEQKIISQIPSEINYEIVYHEGYSDYFINTMTSHKCEGLNEN